MQSLCDAVDEQSMLPGVCFRKMGYAPSQQLGCLSLEVPTLSQYFNERRHFVESLLTIFNSNAQNLWESKKSFFS